MKKELKKTTSFIGDVEINLQDLFDFVNSQNDSLDGETIGVGLDGETMTSFGMTHGNCVSYDYDNFSIRIKWEEKIISEGVPLQPDASPPSASMPSQHTEDS